MCDNQFIFSISKQQNWNKVIQCSDFATILTPNLIFKIHGAANILNVEKSLILVCIM
jgi:hypothetical protein